MRPMTSETAAGDALLSIRRLSTAFRFEGKDVPVTNDVTFDIYPGEILGLVGESGSGKSVTAKTILRLLPSPPSRVLEGEVLYHGENLLALSEHEMRKMRGNRISMIFQEPMTSLNPVYTCGDQIEEAICLHQKVSRREARVKAEEMLRLVGMSMPQERLKNYPHELSGGMRQRVMIAMALSCKPELLIADEPTTALDPTIQAQILDLILSLQKRTELSVLYITHDLGVVAEVCDRVAVMYAGMLMEIATTKELFSRPLHPYTMGLLRAMPQIDQDTDMLYSIEGTVPHITQMPAGCRFHPRCPYACDLCRNSCPPITEASPGHRIRCFRASELEKGRAKHGVA